jgi:hypothetical protein
MITAEETFAAKEPKDASDYIQRLSEISIRLRKFGRIVFSLTFINLISTCAVILFFVGLEKSSMSNADVLLFWRLPLFISGFSFLCLIVTTFFFEKERRYGDTIFDEVVDELKWDITGSSKQIADERPNLDTRVILRSFLKSEELPLIPGRFGHVIYIAINFLLIIGITLLRLSGF